MERVHTDLSGKITPQTHDGFNYFLSFIDDFSHFTIVYVIKRKSEVFHYFRKYEREVTAKFGQKIASLRLDKGTEYFSNDQKKILR